MSAPPTVVLRCAGAGLPRALDPAADVRPVAALPTRAELAAVLAAGPGRLVVLAGDDGPDAALAAVLSALLRADRLDVELGYAAPRRTPATRAWGLATGERAVRRALTGPARAVALVRDETGTALVGRARWTGVEGAPLTGEAYADDVLLFSGRVAALELVPGPDGVTARTRVGLRRRRATARAVQLGCTGATVERDGISAPRPVRRSTFYRHVADWHLVG